MIQRWISSRPIYSWKGNKSSIQLITLNETSIQLFKTPVFNSIHYKSVSLIKQTKPFWFNIDYHLTCKRYCPARYCGVAPSATDPGVCITMRPTFDHAITSTSTPWSMRALAKSFRRVWWWGKQYVVLTFLKTFNCNAVK